MREDNANIPSVSIDYLYQNISKDTFEFTGDELIFLATVKNLVGNDKKLAETFLYGGSLSGTDTASEAAIGRAITLRDAIENHYSSDDFILEDIYLDVIHHRDPEDEETDNWDTWGQQFASSAESYYINVSLVFADDIKDDDIPSSSTLDIIQTCTIDGEEYSNVVYTVEFTPSSTQPQTEGSQSDNEGEGTTDDGDGNNEGTEGTTGSKKRQWTIGIDSSNFPKYANTNENGEELIPYYYHLNVPTDSVIFTYTKANPFYAGDTLHLSMFVSPQATEDEDEPDPTSTGNTVDTNNNG